MVPKVVLESSKASRGRLQKEPASLLCDSFPLLLARQIFKDVPASLVDFWRVLGPKKLHLSDGNLSPPPSIAKSEPVIDVEDP